MVCCTVKNLMDWRVEWLVLIEWWMENENFDSLQKKVEEMGLYLKTEKASFVGALELCLLQHR